jgi:hypothetical protein
MEDWTYWQKVVIVMLAIIVVILGYRRFLRWLGGNSRFDDKFAFLHPLEQKEINVLGVRFELPKDEQVSLHLLNKSDGALIEVLSDESMNSGVHVLEIDLKEFQGQDFELRLITGNQRIDRPFRKL